MRTREILRATKSLRLTGIDSLELVIVSLGARGISLLSIRTIIDESEPDPLETLEDLYPVDTFIINNSRNWPYRSNPPLQCLRNGAPIWNIPNLLRPMYSEQVIQQIMQGIPEEDPHHVYQVVVEHRFNEGEIVSVNRLNGYS